jgi:hypothetical protein
MLAVLFLVSGCGSAPRVEAREDRAADASSTLGAPGSLKAGQAPLTERLLVKRASLDLEADDLDATQAAAERIARAADGYVESTRGQAGHSLGLSLRVPVDKLDATLAKLAELGSIERQSVSSEDVTAEAVDLDARRKNLVAVRDRLRALYDRAANVAEVVAVEKELAQVQGELDAFEARLKLLRSSAALSAVELSVERPHLLGPLGYLGYGLFWVVSKLFLIR